LLEAPRAPVEAPLTDAEAGILLYIAARLLFNISGGHKRVLGVLSSRAAFLSALDADALVVWPLTLRVGPAQGTLRVWAPAAATLPPALSATPRALAALPLALHLCRGWTALRPSELMGLRPGDAVLIDRPTPPDALFALLQGARRELFWVA